MANRIGLVAFWLVWVGGVVAFGAFAPLIISVPFIGAMLALLMSIANEKA